MGTWQCAKCQAIVPDGYKHDCDGKGRAIMANLFKAEQQRAETADREAAETACPECAEPLKRVAELERAINRLGGSPPVFPVTFAQLARAQEARIAELEERIKNLCDYEEAYREAERERDEALSVLRKIRDRAREWNNVPACMDIEHLAADALAVDKRSETEKGGADAPG
jgi:ferredoxin